MVGDGAGLRDRCQGTGTAWVVRSFGCGTAILAVFLHGQDARTTSQ